VREFQKAIQNKSVKSPIERGFKVKSWRGFYQKIESPDEEWLCEAGIIFNELLSDIRTALGELYNQAPKLTRKKLIQSHCAISNRDRKSIVINQFPPDSSENNLLTATTKNTPLGNEVSLQEVADGCVDGIQKAIQFLINKKEEVIQGDNPLEIFEFLKRESYLSQCYGNLEGLWQGIVYGTYELNILDKKNKIIEIKQIDSPEAFGFEISLMRKMKLLAHSALHYTSPQIQKFFINDKYLELTGKGKNKKIRVREIAKSSDAIKFSNTAFKASVLNTSTFFPENFLFTEHGGAGFTLMEVLDVFRVIGLMAEIASDNFPKNDGVHHYSELMAFNITVKQHELCRNITNATGLEYPKVSKIIYFLTFKGEKNEDLWCHPLIMHDSQEFVVLYSSISSPNFYRLIEHWLVKLEVDIGDKGYSFEDKLIENISDSLIESNKLISFEMPVSKRIKLENDEEEIDFIMKVGRKIIVGEAKSIVTTDSPISKYRTLNVLKKASAQAKRKLKFVQDNVADVFRKLDWEFTDEKLDYIPIIFNSNKAMVGFKVDDVPVCDELIFSSYFNKDKIPLFSDDTGRALAWFKLYKDEKELVENLDKYLANPPQVNMNSENYRYDSMRLPLIKDSSYKLMVTRLIAKNMQKEDYLKSNNDFVLEKSDDYNQKIAEMDIMV
jgi:hypothetical protein